MNSVPLKLTRYVFSALVVLMLVVVGLWFATTRVRAQDAKETKLKALLNERAVTATLMAEQTKVQFKSGKATIADMIQTNQTANRAKLDLCESQEARVLALQQIVATAKELEDYSSASVQAGLSSSTMLLAAKVQRLEAEIALERAKTTNADPSGR